MPIIGCTKEDNCKRDAFLKSRQLAAERATENPHKQEKSTDPRKIAEAAVLSSVTSDLPGNPDDVARHAAGNKHLGERAAAAALEDPIAVAQKDSVEIPQATTTAPETIVQAQQAGVSELSVDGEETRTENQRAARKIPDTELRRSQDGV
ncbi:uncharacterized protein [Linepithema humile]|uniref:uncharacterized protein isoform X2 n=1 Tax=Linepithema humile TaxID=83485 RepID=UPI00351E4DAC